MKPACSNGGHVPGSEFIVRGLRVQGPPALPILAWTANAMRRRSGSGCLEAGMGRLLSQSRFRAEALLGDLGKFNGSLSAVADHGARR